MAQDTPSPTTTLDQATVQIQYNDHVGSGLIIFGNFRSESVSAFNESVRSLNVTSTLAHTTYTASRTLAATTSASCGSITIGTTGKLPIKSYVGTATPLAVTALASYNSYNWQFLMLVGGLQVIAY